MEYGNLYLVKWTFTDKASVRYWRWWLLRTAIPPCNDGTEVRTPLETAAKINAKRQKLIAKQMRLESAAERDRKYEEAKVQWRKDDFGCNGTCFLFNERRAKIPA